MLKTVINVIEKACDSQAQGAQLYSASHHNMNVIASSSPHGPSSTPPPSCCISCRTCHSFCRILQKFDQGCPNRRSCHPSMVFYMPRTLSSTGHGNSRRPLGTAQEPPP